MRSSPVAFSYLNITIAQHFTMFLFDQIICCAMSDYGSLPNGREIVFPKTGHLHRDIFRSLQQFDS
jgi:hypothetical protein